MRVARAVSELTEQGSPDSPILAQLLKVEKSYRRPLKARPRFPNYRDLTSFDFVSSEINEALV
jgi:hypothetical protein